MAARDLVAFSLAPLSLARKTALLGALADWPDDPHLLELFLEVSGIGVAADTLRRRADQALARAHAAGVQTVDRFDARYPARLRVLPDAPPVLWVLGEASVLADRTVAVVGSRAASSYGIEVAERLSFDLGAAGVVVVSGMARGCDGAAHRGALAGGGRSVAVLGSGPDVVYPPEHEALHRDLIARGAVVSELPPGTPPLPRHFPLRNRLISGLSAGVVVVEASDRSGSLITAGCALDQGREVMAVPGSVLGQRHGGCHALLRDGAALVQTASEVCEVLGWRTAELPSGDQRGLSNEAGLLGYLLPGEDCDVDTLVVRSGLSAPAVLSQLMQLELAGSVRRGIGGGFLRRVR
jgi:DNA processing protein